MSVQKVGLNEIVVVRVERGGTTGIRRIAFDLDGVLVDTDELHYLALNMALTPYGIRISAAEHFGRFKGLPTLVKCQMLTDEGKLPVAEHAAVFAAKQRETARAIELVVKPNQDKLDLLDALVCDGWRICICSNAIRSTVQALVNALGASRFVDFLLSNEDIARPKPAPDIYRVAADRFGVAVGDLVVVEDAPPGIKAAQDAGCRVVVVQGPDEVTPKLLERIYAVAPPVA